MLIHTLLFSQITACFQKIGNCEVKNKYSISEINLNGLQDHFTSLLTQKSAKSVQKVKEVSVGLCSFESNYSVFRKKCNLKIFP